MIRPGILPMSERVEFKTRVWGGTVSARRRVRYTSQPGQHPTGGTLPGPRSVISNDDPTMADDNKSSYSSGPVHPKWCSSGRKAHGWSCQIGEDRAQSCASASASWPKRIIRSRWSTRSVTKPCTLFVICAWCTIPNAPMRR